MPEPDGGYLAADGGCLHWAVAGAGPAVVAIHDGSADLREASAAPVGFSAEGAIAAEFTVRRDHPETADLCSTRWRLAITGGRAYSALGSLTLWIASRAA